MTLAFYKVDNSKDYERHTFDYFYDKPQEIEKMLSELSDEELRMYNMNSEFDVGCLQEDYNDEVLDCGWWCVVINETEG